MKIKTFILFMSIATIIFISSCTYGDINVYADFNDPEDVYGKSDVIFVSKVITFNNVSGTNYYYNIEDIIWFKNTKGNNHPQAINILDDVIAPGRENDLVSLNEYYLLIGLWEDENEAPTIYIYKPLTNYDCSQSFDNQDESTKELYWVYYLLSQNMN